MSIAKIGISRYRNKQWIEHSNPTVQARVEKIPRPPIQGLNLKYPSIRYSFFFIVKETRILYNQTKFAIKGDRRTRSSIRF